MPLRSIGDKLNPYDFIPKGVLNPRDILIIVRGGRLDKPLAIYYEDFLKAISSGSISVSEDGGIVVSRAANINFTGAGVSVTQDGDSATVNIPGGSGSGPTLQTDGVDNPVQTLLNLIAGEYINLTANLSGGVTIDVVGILSSEIVVFNLGDGPITIADQSDNHATKIDMGTWDGLSPFNIVYNTKTDPKDGAILEIEISDTFATDASPAGPGSVNLEVKYGSTTIFNESVDADRAIRFRYEADSDVWFPISYVSVVSPPGSVISVTGINVDNSDPANPVVETFTSIQIEFSVASAPVINLDATSTPNHLCYIDSAGFDFAGLTVNGYASPKDGAFLQVLVNKRIQGAFSICGAFIGGSGSDVEPSVFWLRYSTTFAAWLPIIRVPISPSGGSGTVTNVSADINEDEALDVTVTDPTTTPDIQLAWQGADDELVSASGKIRTLPGSVVENAGAIELDGDNPTPSAQEYYGTDLSSAKGFHSLPDAVKSITKEMYESSMMYNGAASGMSNVLYVEDYDLLYVTITGNVLVFDTTTGARVATLVIASALACFYVKDVNDGAGGTRDEVWVGVAGSTTINRLSTANPPTNLGTFTNTSGSGAYDWVDYNNQFVYLANLNGGTIAKIDKTTNPPSAVSSVAATNIISISLCANGSSAQNDRIFVCQRTTGVSLYNPNTDTITIAATTLGGTIGNAWQVAYCESLDRWIVADLGRDRLIYIEPATATSFAADGFTYNIGNAISIYCDNLNDKIFTTFLLNIGAVNRNVAVSSIDPSTKLIDKTLLLSGTATTQAHFISKLGAANQIWVGCSATRSTHQVIYF